MKFADGFWLNQSNYSKIYFSPADFWGEDDCYVSFWGTNIPQSWPGLKMDRPSGTAAAAYIPTAMISNIIINNGGNGKRFSHTDKWGRKPRNAEDDRDS